ncbi:BQ5605_C001g00267 [Microbotryum silenes-dioicae]|uniref:BQ5605_C001g00267 protein n=1 Tax=Microbotryum silenes-dioicae TaxID=796604 RepID=A0A2X0M721_9BASI|nr:BQ5605_C001g00267 [Microbotryum silenes-dioicae]
MARGQLECFCQSTISPEDGDDAHSSEWSALTSCGHVYHTKCIKKWIRSHNRAEAICPLHCPSRHVSMRSTDRSHRRTPYPLVRLYFEADVTSDGVQSQLAGASQAASVRREVAAARVDHETDDEENDVDDERENVLTGERPATRLARRARSEQEVDRLRRELRETQATVRELGPLRELTREQALRLEELEETCQAKESVIDDLEGELGRRMEELVQYECGQPGAHQRIMELEVRVDELTGVIEVAFDELSTKRAEATKLEAQLREVESEAHEAKIKHREEVARLKATLAMRGEEGEKTIQSLREQIDGHDKALFAMQLAQDRIQHQADERVAECQRATTKAIDKADEKAALAAQAQTCAQEQVGKLKGQLQRLEAALKSWESKQARTRHKYEELKRRRPKAAISDDEYENCPVVPVPRSPAAACGAARALSPSTTADTGLTFRIKNTVMTSSSFASNADRATPSPSPRKRQRLTTLAAAAPGLRTEVIEITDSDDDEDLYGLPSPRHLSSSKHPPLAASAQPPRGTVPMPTMTDARSNHRHASGRCGSKPQLSKLSSDKYLPDFATGTTEHGPKNYKRLAGAR